jgi:hypothetical protein
VKRLLGTARLKWEDHIEIVEKLWTLCRDKGRAVLNTVMNIRVP